MATEIFRIYANKSENTFEFIQTQVKIPCWSLSVKLKFLVDWILFQFVSFTKEIFHSEWILQLPTQGQKRLTSISTLVYYGKT